ncbi:hypothetical protein [Hymenobacter arizonensis]|uniref:Uncharacterized protein n=1 Tax=Hymenobacter arizonensis TaxID=1227077 RepID=A0A1I6BQJ0_HYMAR|nr:hypothetical protein [Hymenobacter arizonensis]SFQ83171.1 hypothetical protein SAMN04515668_4920 [Hymenobacter arizonensis]
MDVVELERALITGGYRGWFLAGGQMDDTVTLNRTRDGWEVYYSERGKKSGERTFQTEDEACRYFLAFISGSSTAIGDKH